MPNWKKVVVSGSSPDLNNITANQFAKIGGTSAQFLKADGSVDSSTYLTSVGTINLTSDVTGTLPVGSGGTGATTFTAGRVLIGNGTSAITTDSGFTYSSNKLGIDGTITSNTKDIISNASSATTLIIGDVVGNDSIEQLDFKAMGVTAISITDSQVEFTNDIGIKISNAPDTTIEGTALMITSNGAVQKRDLGSNAFNSTAFLTSLSGAVLTSGNQTATGTKTFSGRVDMDTSLNMGDNAVIAFDEGTVSAPGIGIAQEPTTGFYKEAGNSNLCISLAGSKIMRYDDTHVELNQELKLSDLNASTVDTDKFLVAASDGDVEFRTGAEVLSDIGITSLGSGAIISTSERSNISSNTSNISGKAASGANSDITSLSGLTTALSVTQGGTGATSLGDISLSSFDDDLNGTYVDLANAQTISGTKTFSVAQKFTTGTVSAPSISFNSNNAYTTGFYLSNPHEISIARVGVQNFKFDSSGFQCLLTGTSQFTGHLQAHCLGIGIAPSTTSGEIWASGDIVANKSSDRRLKKKIKNIPNALEKVSQINGVTFEWKKTNEKMKKEVHSHEGQDVGVIAQEIEEVLPEIVATRDNGYKAVYYEKLVPLLIEAVKELKAEVDELKKSK